MARKKRRHRCRCGERKARRRTYRWPTAEKAVNVLWRVTTIASGVYHVVRDIGWLRWWL
ncbi:hypothetical protein KBX50_31140 [Micromonospora sp. C51]|uniref:hypothetical protein n=1 Tax=Micromonospora sp. C51 TaxID=2824879 RepID=UPI001B36B65F|nr:hypothetical protein [Micromonospora sp. C51]MBQ1052893.1 hypothetical protein [Micromonospora sp. C51]